MRVYCTLTHESWHPVLGHLVPGEQELSIATAKAQVAFDSLVQNGILRLDAPPMTVDAVEITGAEDPEAEERDHE